MTPQSGALAWLDTTQRFGIKLGLENTFRLLDAVGQPQKSLRFLHVAGTNGKGSVCAFIESILRESGFRAGLYTSPHLVDFRERIQIAGTLIPRTDLDRILVRIQSATASWEHSPTFFEVTTVAALLWFAGNHVDYVVLETGMGGRLDATNAVTPIVSVITPIGMDHQQWLGNTLAEIAGEKAGIIKPGVPAVSAPQHPDAMAVLRARAATCETSLDVATPLDATVELGLHGFYQRANAALAVATLRAAGIPAGEEAIWRGLKNVRWPGRLQNHGRFWFDGAHNPDGTRVLVQAWREMHGDIRPVVIFGALAEKGIPEMLAALADICTELWVVPIRNPRAESPETIASLSPLSARTWESLAVAMESAGADGRPILVTGSLFLIGEALEFLQAPRF